MSRRAVPVPSIDQTPAMRLLPLVLGLIAGSCDIISFIGLGGLFIAHITGNLVIIADRIVVGDGAPTLYLLSVPVFITVLGLVRSVASALDVFRLRTLTPFGVQG